MKKSKMTRNDRKIRVPEADTMPLERWTAYMWTILIIKGITKTHYLCTNNGESWIKPHE